MLRRQVLYTALLYLHICSTVNNVPRTADTHKACVGPGLAGHAIPYLDSALTAAQLLEQSPNTKQVEVLLHPLLCSSRRTAAFWRVPKLHPSVHTHLHQRVDEDEYQALVG